LSTIAQIPPPWFDTFWEEQSPKLPFLLRSEGAKHVAWGLFQVLMEQLSQQATTPRGMQTVIAFAKIKSILKGAQGVLDSPDPSPAQVAEAVQKLVDKVGHANNR
jgi:hypothetical protein